MRKHLYELKKSCSATAKDIDLTDEQKDKILANRILQFEDQSTVTLQ